VPLVQKAIFHYFPALGEAQRKVSNTIGSVFGHLASEGFIACGTGDHFLRDRLASQMLPAAGSLEKLPELAIEFNQYIGNGSLEDFLKMTGSEGSRVATRPLIKALLKQLNNKDVEPSDEEVHKFMTEKESTINNIQSGLWSALGW